MKARKILSAIMAIAMIAVFAVSVSAADGVREVDTYEKLAEALESGGEIKLIANITDARMATVPQGVSAVLDLNGYSISTAHQSGDTTKHEYAIDNLGTLTIKDSSAEKTGEINARGVYNGYNNSTNHIVTAKLVIDGAKIVNLDSNGGACLWGYGGDIIVNDATLIGYTGCVSSEGYLEINDGTYTCYSGIGDDGTIMSSPTYNIRAYNGLKITGGTFTSRHGVISIGGGVGIIEGGSYKIEFTAGTTSNVVYAYEDAKLTIKDGEFLSDNTSGKADSGAAVLVSGENASLEIENGTYVGMNGMVSGNENTVISGGSYDTVWDYNHYDKIESFVAVDAVVEVGGETLTKNEDGEMVALVAKIGDDYYESFQAAINDAADAATEQVPVTVELLQGEFMLDTYTLPNMEYVTIKGAADKKSVIKDTLITNSGAKTDNIAHIVFDGIVFDNSRIYLNGWDAGMKFADWTITNCEFNNLSSETSVGGVVQFNLSSGMIVGEWGPYNDVALDGFAFTNNVVNGAHCNGVCSAVNSQAMEGTIIIENNIFNDIDFNAIQLQNVPETATVSIKNNTISNSGSALVQLNNNLAEIEMNKNVFVVSNENQLYVSHVSTEINASENFFGTGTSVEDAVFNENYAEQMHIKSGVSSPVVESYYKDAELTEKVTLGTNTVDPAFGTNNGVIKLDATETDYEVVVLATIDSLDYRNVGLEVTFGSQKITEVLDTVYEAVRAKRDENSEADDISPADFGGNGKFIFLSKVTFGLSHNATEEFSFRPFATKLDGTVIYGKTTTDTIGK